MSKKKEKESQKPAVQQSPAAETPSGEQAGQAQTTEVQETDPTKNAESVIPPSQTAKERATKMVEAFARQAAAKHKEQSEFIAPYTKAYPKEKTFYVTSDKQVFLEKDRGLAVLHQNSLGGEEKVQTVPVK